MFMKLSRGQYKTNYNIGRVRYSSIIQGAFIRF
jgi:hypothetical protein